MLMPSSLNATLENENDKTIYYHIFFKSSRSDDLEYVNSDSSIFNDTFKISEKVLTFGQKI